MCVCVCVCVCVCTNINCIMAKELVGVRRHTQEASACACVWRRGEGGRVTVRLG